MHLDPQWVSSEVLTEAIGTLRSIALPDVHSGEQAAARASEAIEHIDRSVEKKLREHGIEVDDDEA